MSPARRVPRLFVFVFLGVFMLTAVSALASAEDGDGDAKPASDEAVDGKPRLTLAELETMMKENPAALWLGALSRFGALGIGIILLIRYWLFWDKVNGGAALPPPRIAPPVLFPVGLALLLAFGAVFILPTVITMIFMGINGTDAAAATEVAFIATAAATLPLAAIVILRHHRLGPTVSPRAAAPSTPAESIAAQHDDILAEGDPGVTSLAPETAPAIAAFDVGVATAPVPKRSFIRGVGLGLWTFCVAAVVVVPAFIAAAAVMMAFGVTPEPQDLVQEVILSEDAALPIWVLIFGVLIAPLTEECIFRGLLYPSIKQGMGGTRKAAIWSAMIVSFVFALIHMDATAFLPLFFLALVLTWVYERTGSLTAVIVAHATNNLLSLLPLIVLRA